MTLRVLVVDDAKYVREAFARCIRDAGHDVVIAVDGLAAVELLCEAPVSVFDVVLMDIDMPRLDGLAATRKIRESAITQPRIVGVHGGAVSSEMCLEAGMDAVLWKPLGCDELIAEVETVEPKARRTTE